MNVRVANSHRRQTAGTSHMQLLLIVLIVLAALDLTRRFVTLFVRFSENERRSAAQVIEPSASNMVASGASASPPSAPPAVAMTAPSVQAAVPSPPPAFAQSRVANDSETAPSTAYQLNDQVGGRMQKDYPLWSATTPVTFFAPWAVTLISTPDDDGGDPNENPTPSPQ